MLRATRVLIGAAAMAIAAAPLAVHTALADPVSLEVTDAAGAAMMGDPAKGDRVFKRCQACHSIKEGENKVGPSLHGIIGRAAGTVANYNYSNANKTSGITWTQQELFVYLENPQKVVKGTKMAFPGLPKPQDRADVIAYLLQNAM